MQSLAQIVQLHLHSQDSLQIVSRVQFLVPLQETAMQMSDTENQ